ncbi:hypothetical protein BC629DRAFT_944709 [Irpex lacteus]|nr:hypothetical protein BC629DRAFT_944709 [Irpex lacteus]
MPLRAILPDGNKSATRTAKSKQGTRAATNSKANSDESQFILATSQTLSHGKTRQARRARPHELNTLPKYHEVVTKWKTAVRYLSRPEIKMILTRTFDFDEKTSFADRVSLICLKSEFPIEPWILGDMQCLVETSTIHTCMVCLYNGDSEFSKNTRSYRQKWIKLARHSSTNHHVDVVADLLRVTPASLQSMLQCGICHKTIRCGRDYLMARHMDTCHPSGATIPQPFDRDDDEIHDKYQDQDLGSDAKEEDNTSVPAPLPLPQATDTKTGMIAKTHTPKSLRPRPGRSNLQRSSRSIASPLDLSLYDASPDDTAPQQYPLSPLTSISSEASDEIEVTVTQHVDSGDASATRGPESSIIRTPTPTPSPHRTYCETDPVTRTSPSQSHVDGPLPLFLRPSASVYRRLAPNYAQIAEKDRGRVCVPRPPEISPLPPATIPTTAPIRFGRTLPLDAQQFSFQAREHSPSLLPPSLVLPSSRHIRTPSPCVARRYPVSSIRSTISPQREF